jgi:hypothetical protein
MKNIKWLLCSIISIAIFGSCENNSTSPTKRIVQKRPNILFVSIDDLGPNLGVYDNTVMLLLRPEQHFETPTAKQQFAPLLEQA